MPDEANSLAPLCAGRVVSEEWKLVYLMVRAKFFVSLLRERED